MHAQAVNTRPSPFSWVGPGYEASVYPPFYIYVGSGSFKNDSSAYSVRGLNEDLIVAPNVGSAHALGWMTTLQHCIAHIHKKKLERVKLPNEGESFSKEVKQQLRKATRKSKDPEIIHI